MEYLKKAVKSAAIDEQDVRSTVQGILDAIEAGGDDAVRQYAAQFDKVEGEIIVSPEQRAASHKLLN